MTRIDGVPDAWSRVLGGRAILARQFRASRPQLHQRLLEAGVDLDLLPVVKALPDRVGQEDH